MNTVIGFFTAAQAAGATNVALGAVADQSITVSSNARFILPQRMKARAGLAVCANLTAARINAPSLRSFILPQIYPGNVGATVASPVEVADWGTNGPVIQANEELAIETSNNAGAAVVASAVLFLTDGNDPNPAGPYSTLVATAAVTLVAGQWVFSQLVFDQVLPTGEYTVVGMRASCPNGLAARLVFPGQTQWRPGCVTDNAYSGKQIRTPWTTGLAGVYGKFRNTAQPGVEVLGLVAGAQTLTCFLDLMKTG